MPSNESVKRSLALIESDHSKLLTLSVGKHTPKLGTYIAKADAQSAPTLTLPTAPTSPSQTYLAVALDIDAPTPSIPILGPILHWIQPGLHCAPNSCTLSSTEPFVANYIGPAPPPGSAPHRYVFLVYAQPAGFDGAKWAPPGGKQVGNWKRMWWSLDDWERAVGLGEVVAGNWFTSN